MEKPIRVLITRPIAQATQLAMKLKSLGYQSSVLPLIEIQQVNLKTPVRVADTLIFISANAVRCGLNQLMDIDFSAKRILAIGPATAATLAGEGLDSDLAESGFRSEDLLQKLNLETNRPQQITLVCGESGRDFLEAGLRDSGITVNRLEVYRRCPSKNIEEALSDLDKSTRPDLLSLMNEESLKLLNQAISNINLEHWKSIAILASSPRIQQTAKDLGFLQVFCQTDPTESGLIDFLTQFSP